MQTQREISEQFATKLPTLISALTKSDI